MFRYGSSLKNRQDMQGNQTWRNGKAAMLD